MQDRLNSRLMGVNPTGNGRRESYAHAPMPRMTNTYMLSGDKSPEEIIKSVKNGLYAVDFGGGQVDITNGKFVFTCTEAYKIKDGKVDQPVKGATLIGSGPEVLKRVKLVVNDSKMEQEQGHGKRWSKCACWSWTTYNACQQLNCRWNGNSSLFFI